MPFDVVLVSVVQWESVLIIYMKVKLLSHVQLFATPWNVAYQAPLSMGFFRRILEWVAISFSNYIYMCAYIYNIQYKYQNILSSQDDKTQLIYIYLSPLEPLSPSHPSGHHRAPGGLPVLYSSFPLAICFTHDSVYVLTLLSQFNPPSPSPTVFTGPKWLISKCHGQLVGLFSRIKEAKK